MFDSLGWERGGGGGRRGFVGSALNMDFYIIKLFFIVLNCSKHCLGSGSVGSGRFWLPGCGSAKICRSTDPDPRGKISTKNCKKKYLSYSQRFGSGSGRIRIIWSDPDPYQETLIWIRVAPKIIQNHGINKSKWFVNVLFTWRKFF